MTQTGRSSLPGSSLDARPATGWKAHPRSHFASRWNISRRKLEPLTVAGKKLRGVNEHRKQDAGMRIGARGRPNPGVSGELARHQG